MTTPASHTPDVSYPASAYKADSPVARPSWSANPGFVDDGHRTVFAETKDIPGWQLEGDAYKLYEMAYFAGDVILDLGAYGGRSAVVELKGALGRADRAQPPQVFSIDIERAAIHRSHESLKAFGLSKHVLLFQGGVEALFQNFEIGPSMVFVDADHAYEGVRRDLDTLSRVLAPGVPVLCHDYLNPENNTGEYGVRRAATEWQEAGFVDFMGTFGCSVFFRTTDRCTGTRRRLPDDEFSLRRDACLIAYGLTPMTLDAGDTLALARARALERELAAVQSSRSYKFARTLVRLARPVRGLFR